MSKSSILRFGVLQSLALMLLAALVTIGVYQTRTRLAPEVGDLAAKPVMATQIEFLAETMRRTAEGIAAHPQTLACLESAAANICQRLAANLCMLHPDATVLLVSDGPRGARRLLPGFLPGRTQRLISAATADGPSAASVTPNLSLSHSVVNARGKHLGFVVVEQSVPQLQALLDTLPLPESTAYAELQQGQGDTTPTVLMRRGNQAIKAGTLPSLIELQGTPWNIAVWKNDRPEIATIAPYLLAWVLASLMAAALVAANLWLLRNRVLDNLRELVKLVNDIRQQRLRNAYAVTLTEFDGPLRTVMKLGKVMMGKQKEASVQARVDHLSQVHNRRSFEEKQKELFASLKDGWTHSLLILDIDNFKQVNDTFGHEAGDQLIIKFGLALKKSLRTSDFIARLGGDEFCVLFPFTPLDRAKELAERLRENMPDSVELIPGVMQKLSWSGGLGAYSQHDRQENEALARADAALLEAKRSGRNTTRVSAVA